MKFYYILFFLKYILSCEQLELSSNVLGKLIFNVLSINESLNSYTTGRGVYKTILNDKELYLYHTTTLPHSEGNGRWLINDILGSDSSGYAYIDSWSIMPQLIHAVNDPNKIYWYVSTNDGWQIDHSFHFQCFKKEGDEYDVDNTIFLEVPGFATSLSGFYVQVGSIDGNVIFSHIRSDDSPHRYLYKRGNLWLISEELNSNNGLAFVEDQAHLPAFITSIDWRFSSNGEWIQYPAAVYSGNKERNIYATLRQTRSLPHLPGNQKYFRLRNEVILPATGLGTGGIPLDITREVFVETYRLGYRFYDLAREYNNEEIMGRLFETNIPRNEVFILSKVWPTNLGYQETINEVLKSLSNLHTSYIDSYLIHWPFCISSVEWMHCDNIVNPNGTWVQSWKALERLYSEGKLLSIGVSNFDIELLQHIEQLSLISPHIVQNYGTLVSLDIDVRIWCSHHQTVYIPYATGRNYNDLPQDLLDRVKEVAQEEEISINAVISRFFLTTGTAVIPRSTNITHLHENINVVPLRTLSEDNMLYLGWNPGTPRQEL